MPKEPLTEVITDRDALVLEASARAEPEAFFRMIEGGYVSFEAIVDFLNRRARKAKIPIDKYVLPKWNAPEHDDEIERILEVFHAELLDPWPPYRGPR